MFDTQKTIFLSIAGMDPGWIVGKIAEDILAILKTNGVTCRYGSPSEYKDEQIVYHLGYAYAKPEQNAEVNSLFITHIDDKLKENQIVEIKDEFDSFICMSVEEKEYLVQLGFDRAKTFGLTLPVRNDYVKPVSLGIFSACYQDGRKNEKWIIDFVKNENDTHLLNFVFIGSGWGGILDDLSNAGCSFEWHNVSRKMPYEYKFQQNKLEGLSGYFYLGFDGGAMGTYDAYAYGIPLLISDQSYHKDLPHVEHFVENYDDFKRHMIGIIDLQKQRLDFFEAHSVENYVSKLHNIWSGIQIENECNFKTTGLLEKKRKLYFSLSIRRILSMLKRKIS